MISSFNHTLLDALLDVLDAFWTFGRLIGRFGHFYYFGLFWTSIHSFMPLMIKDLLCQLHVLLSPHLLELGPIHLGQLVLNITRHIWRNHLQLPLLLLIWLKNHRLLPLVPFKPLFKLLNIGLLLFQGQIPTLLLMKKSATVLFLWLGKDPEEGLLTIPVTLPWSSSSNS